MLLNNGNIMETIIYFLACYGVVSLCNVVGENILKIIDICNTDLVVY
jgi:hypothetical protein